MSTIRKPSLKRWHPYLGEWVIIAPATQGRPWSGATVTPQKSDQPAFDPGCYLCPGVTRASGNKNPQYDGVYIFDNDFPSLSMDYSTEGHDTNQDDIPARGICRVVCFSPLHNVTLPMLAESEVASVVAALCDEYKRLSATPEIEYVMPFENRGKIIGVSNPHPHGQIYSTDYVPRMPLAMYANAKAFHSENGGCIFCKVLEDELSAGDRIVTENDNFVAFVPSFARHTFEIHLMPRRHVPYMSELTSAERQSLAQLYREVLIRYDNLFSMPFPNITVFQNAPCGTDIDPEPYHFRIEFYPPLRDPDKLKYMAGFESGGGNIINPSMPRDSATALRNTSTEHYTAQL